MKMPGYKCDRCGRLYDRNTGLTNSKGNRLIGVALVDLKKNLERYDLCDVCLLEVYSTITRMPIGLADEDNEMGEEDG